MRRNTNRSLLATVRSSAGRIAAIYLAISVVWILVSDELLHLLVRDPDALEALSVLKGWGFVIVTALLLYGLIRHDMTALQASERRYRLISENAGDVIWILDTARRTFKYVSPSVEKLRGFAPEEVLQQSLAEMLTPESLQLITDLLPARLASFAAGDESARVQINEVDQIHRDGSIVPTEVVTTLLPDDTGQISEILGVSRNIAARKQIEERLVYHANLLANVKDAVTATDERFVLTFWNRAAEEMFGWRADEVLGRPGAEVLRTEFIGIDRADAYRSVQESGQFRGELIQYRRDGAPVFVEANTLALRDKRGRITGYASVSRDITERKQMEEALRDSEARFRSYIEYAPLGVLITDRFSRCLEVNFAAARLLGYTQAEIIKRSLSDTLAPESLDKGRLHFQILVQLGSATTELLLERQDGSTVWVTAHAMRLADDRFLTYLQDISPRKRAEAELQTSAARLAGVIDSAMDAIITLDDQQHVVLFNAAAEKMFRCTAAEALGQPLDHFIPERFRAVHRRHIRYFGETGITTRSMGQLQPLFGLRADGGEFPIEASISQINVDGQKLFTVILRDITARQRAEEKIHQLNAELEQRVLDRTMQLTAANQELEAFAYSVSHDLRAPLRALDGFSRILAEEYARRLDGEGQRYLHIVRTNAQQMGHLIDALLALSQLSRRTLSKQAIDVNRLVHEVLAGLQREAAPRSIDLAVADLPLCQADPTLLKQVWLNLLSNAFKYTRAQAQARIEIGSSAMDGQAVYFVRDNGAGFDMQYVGKLFGVFQRLHRAEDYEGTGVGLALTKRIVERHGGRIWAEAEVNRGATFYFTLS